jgi:hypothetical protein
MTDEPTRKVLDLDELFGQARAVKVRYAGKEYELLRMEGISPKQAWKFQNLKQRANALQQLGAELAEGDADELNDLMKEMLQILCAELPLGEMPFLMRLRVLTFYIEETQGKNVLKTVAKLTGAKSSHA